jgi:hypothetical protein
MGGSPEPPIVSLGCGAATSKEGAGRDEILKSYPSLKPEHLDAAIAYAAALAREESLLPVTSL